MNNTDESLLKTTLRTMAIMVGACVTFIGALTLVVLFVVGRAVSPASSGANTAPEIAPVNTTDAPRGPANTQAPRRPASMANGSNQPI